MPYTFKAVCLAGFFAIIAGCSTVTKEVVNPTPDTAITNSPAISKDAGKSLKRVVAIARFSNETRSGQSFLVDSSYDRVGKQAADILAIRLTDSGKFIMLERSDLGKVDQERKLAKLSSQSVGANFLIVGSVSEFGRSNVSEVGIFSRNKKQKVNAVVNVRLVNVNTGEIIYSEEGGGESVSEANTVMGVGAKASYDSSLDDKALSAAILKLVSNLIENLMDQQWRSYLLSADKGVYTMAGGKTQGIEIGSQFSVFMPGKQVKNPQTGMNIELPPSKVAEIQVTSQAGKGKNEISLCSLVSGDVADLTLDKVYVAEKGEE